MEALEDIVIPIEGLGSVDLMSFSCGKLDEAMHSYDCPNGTCGARSIGSCKKWYSSIFKVEKKNRRTSRDLVKNHEKNLN